jgi:hypothetical protein
MTEGAEGKIVRMFPDERARIRKAWRAQLAKWDEEQLIEINDEALQEVRRKDYMHRRMQEGVWMLARGDCSLLGDALIEILEIEGKEAE